MSARTVTMYRVLSGEVSKMWGVGFEIGRHDHESTNRLVSINPNEPVKNDCFVPFDEAQSLFSNIDNNRKVVVKMWPM
jgi:hypothetical protein